MTKEFALNYLEDLKGAINDLPLEQFEEVVDLIIESYEGGHQIFIMGNGGSGTTASHFACDINKGVCFGFEKRFKVICLNDNIPTILAYANDNSYDDIFVEQLKNFLKSDDVVIGISGSGNSRNVIKAFQYANEQNAVSIAFTGFGGVGKLAKIAKVSLVVPSNDMQKIEDIHLIITHIIMQILNRKLGTHKLYCKGLNFSDSNPTFSQDRFP
jgi:D-sedoheptulose 7-phosphate isomerase